jgi:hypothetical protein
MCAVPCSGSGSNGSGGGMNNLRRRRAAAGALPKGHQGSVGAIAGGPCSRDRRRSFHGEVVAQGGRYTGPLPKGCRRSCKIRQRPCSRGAEGGCRMPTRPAPAPRPKSEHWAGVLYPLAQGAVQACAKRKQAEQQQRTGKGGERRHWGRGDSSGHCPLAAPKGWEEGVGVCVRVRI